MVDIITDNIKPQIDAVGGGRKMTLQEDYDMGIDKGSFIYQENKDRYLKDKNVNVVMPKAAPAKETGEVEGEQKQEAPVPKKSQRVEFAEDTEGATKPIIRGIEKNQAPNLAFTPVFKPRGITRDSTKGELAITEGTLTNNKLAETAKEDLVNQSADMSMSSLADELTIGTVKDNNLPELAPSAFGKAQTALKILASPQASPAAKKRAEKQLDTTLKIINIKKDRADKKLQIAFDRDGKFAPTEEALYNPILKTEQQNYQRGRRNLSKLIDGKFKSVYPNEPELSYNVEQSIINYTSTGSFWDNLIEETLEIPRFVAIDMAQFLRETVQFGTVALVDSLFNNKPIAESNAETLTRRTEIAREWKKTVGEYDLKTLATEMNKSIHDDFKQQLKDGTISQDKYNRLALDNMIDPDGVESTVLKSFISENMSRNILLESIDQLTGAEQGLLIAAENMTGIYSLAKNRAKNAINYKNKVLPKAVRKKQIEEIKKGNFKYWGMSDIEAARAIKADFKKFKVNESLITDALQMEKIDFQFAKLVKEKEKLGAELDNLKRAGLGPNDLDYVKAENAYNSIKGKVFRNAAMARTLPILRESAKMALPASLSQWAATQWLVDKKPGEESTGLSFFDAQAIGAVTHVVFNAMGRYNPYKMAGATSKYIVGQGGNFGNAIADTLEGLASAVGIPGAVGMLRNGDIQAYNDLLIKVRKKGLTIGERAGMKYVFQVAAELSEDNLQKVLKSARAAIDENKRIAEGFGIDTPEYKLVMDITRNTFADATNLGWLKSAEALNHGFLDIRDLKNGGNFNRLIELQEEAEKQLAFTTMALNQFKKRISGTVNLDDNKTVANFINRYEGIVELETQRLIKRRGKLNSRITEIKDQVFLDPDVEVSPELSKNLTDASVELRMKLDKTLTKGKALEDDAASNLELLKGRAEIIASNKTSGKYRDRVALLTEELFENHIESYYARGKSGYQKVDELAEKAGKSVDITSLLKELKDTDVNVRNNPLSEFFAKEGTFSRSTLNKRLRISLNKMAARSLEAMEKSTLEALRKMATKNPNYKHYISDNADDLDIAMYWSEKGKLKAFNALPSEVADVYASFRDYGVRMSKSGQNNRLADLYFDKADRIKNLIVKDAPEYAAEYGKANKLYKQEIFDRQDGKGPLTDYLNSKVERVTEDTKLGQNQFYKNIYKGVKPREIFTDFSNKIEKALKSGKAQDSDDVKDSFEDIIRQLTDYKDGQPMFNLDTKQGRDKYETIVNIISENIYTNWGEKIVDSSNKLQSVRVKKQLLNSMGGYDFSVLDVSRIDALNSRLRGTVLENGVINNNKPFINLSKLITDQKDIVTVMETSADLRAKYARFQKTGNEEIKNIASEVLDNINIRDATIEKLRAITGLDAGGFFKAVEDGRYNFQNINTLRDQVGAKGVSKSEFDEAITYLVTKGLLDKGGLKAIPSSTLSTFEGLKKPLKGFSTPEEMLQALRDDNIKPVLENLLGDNHVAFLDDIAEYLMKQKANLADLDRISGITRPIGTNEMISRAFNIARGMVSPTYVGAELAVRLASNAGIDMLKMAAGDKYAAELMLKMLEFPKEITKLELNTFRRLSIDFVISEYARLDIVIPDYYYDPQASNIETKENNQ